MPSRPRFRRPEILLFVFGMGFLVALTTQVRRGGQSVLGNLALVAFGPLLSAYDSASRLTREGVEAYLWQRDAALEAERLAARNRVLEGKLEMARQSEQEILALRELLHAPRPPGVDFIGGRALTQYGAPFSRYLLVSCDTSHYVPDSTPVIGPDGLVGRVQGSSGNRYKVLLITDPSSAVGVASDRTGVRGVAVGRGKDLEVRWVSNEADVKPGDEFSTSGEDGVFPAGLRVGTVLDVQNGGDYLKKITLSPSCDLGRLTWVLLLRASHG
jgi:rod shape-determining protein MreC